MADALRSSRPTLRDRLKLSFSVPQALSMADARDSYRDRSSMPTLRDRQKLPLNVSQALSKADALRSSRPEVGMSEQKKMRSKNRALSI